MPMNLNAFVQAFRGDYIEDHHAVSLVVMNSAGETLFVAGNPELEVHMRSSAKAFQALALFQSGAFERFGLSLKELSLCCASHDGTADHIETARGILAKIGLDESYLNCGAHLPSDPSTRQALLSHNEKPTSIHNNCSGKHAGMLAIAKALSAPLEAYEAREHPVQELIFQAGTDLTGIKSIPSAIDGCSVPTFILPLSVAACMYAQFADPVTAPEAHREGLSTIFEAMQAYPDMIAGPDSIDTQLMQALPKIAVKRGAQGYYGMAIKDSQHGHLGVTLKLESGSNEARDVFIVELLEYLGVLSSDVPMKWRQQEIKNHRDIVTGHYKANIQKQD